ncbi:hypothetical protein [Rhodohalobacter sp. 614A]|nr:hypothetical protein [Rhodohalobacter sp. 614A]
MSIIWLDYYSNLRVPNSIKKRAGYPIPDEFLESNTDHRIRVREEV